MLRHLLEKIMWTPFHILPWTILQFSALLRDAQPQLLIFTRKRTWFSPKCRGTHEHMRNILSGPVFGRKTIRCWLNRALCCSNQAGDTDSQASSENASSEATRAQAMQLTVVAGWLLFKGTPMTIAVWWLRIDILHQLLSAEEAPTVTKVGVTGRRKVVSCWQESSCRTFTKHWLTNHQGLMGPSLKTKKHKKMKGNNRIVTNSFFDWVHLFRCGLLRHLGNRLPGGISK